MGCCACKLRSDLRFNPHEIRRPTRHNMFCPSFFAKGPDVDPFIFPGNVVLWFLQSNHRVMRQPTWRDMLCLGRCVHLHTRTERPAHGGSNHFTYTRAFFALNKHPVLVRIQQVLVSCVVCLEVHPHFSGYSAQCRNRNSTKQNKYLPGTGKKALVTHAKLIDQVVTLCPHVLCGQNFSWHSLYWAIKFLNVKPNTVWRPA